MNKPSIQPRLIVHGGAGAISRANLPPESYARYAAKLRSVNAETLRLLRDHGATALDAATHAVRLLEDCPLFNCGKGAVFTRDGTIELEASQVMVSKGYRKRGCGVVLIKHVKNPILLAKEILVRGEADGDGGHNGDESNPSSAQGHSVLGGPTVEALARKWGLDMVPESHHWTKKRWDEHKRGLLQSGVPNPSWTQNPKWPPEEESWDGREYLPQGTVGCVALDRSGVLCVATSTGGLTNKLSGRIGDTPTIGAGFWAEEWFCAQEMVDRQPRPQSPLSAMVPDGLINAFADCMPTMNGGYNQVPHNLPLDEKQRSASSTRSYRAVAMSGTGNGDSFLRTAATRTAAAMVRWSSQSLAASVQDIAGAGGELQRSAGDRWGKTSEGEGGIIGIELVDGAGRIVFDFNCGGMFRAWTDDSGNERMMVFREEY
ncbi:MAG: hypothetical protein Q9195_000109 [Heterodermia aff. obscurata]